MKTFLEYVAQDLLQRYGNDLSGVAVVFPNKRAALFLNQALARLADKPLWSPRYTTISDLFRSCSELTVGDPIKLVAELHKVFTAVTGRYETLDQFYGWGQLLLSDFDDIDKNMADASKVFRNLRDYHEIDSIAYLTEEQKNVVRRFFSNFTDDDSALQKRFLQLWSKLYEVYQTYNDSLKAQGLAYEGMLYRSVAVNEDVDLGSEHYVFVGFNMVQKVEQTLFTRLQKEGKASFYWDFDHFYVPQASAERQQPRRKTAAALPHDAGVYIKKYLERFGNQLDSSSAEIYDNLRGGKKIAFVAAATETMQAHYVAEWLREDPQRIAAGNRTAIVMCDEKMLTSVIHSIPPEVQDINITTGYPLQHTPIASLVEQLILLQYEGYTSRQEAFRLHYINKVLTHPYAQFVSPEASAVWHELNSDRVFYVTVERLAKDEAMRLLFTHIEGDGTNKEFCSRLLSWLTAIVKTAAVNIRETGGDDPLREESLFRMFTLLNRLSSLIENDEVEIDKITLLKLLRQIVSSTSVPFHGEPAVGLQVMGVLETRNLDFDHLLILSCNEGNMPKGVDDSSFIPHSLRSAYELTTIDNKVAIYSYYFHRLLQRASDVTIMYNNSTEGSNTGEMSRFMLQMMVELGTPIEKMAIHTKQSQQLVASAPVEKTPEIAARLQDMRFLSPTAIGKYLRCQLSFFYNYIAKLKEPDNDDIDSIDNRVFGNIFHRAAQLMYETLLPSIGRGAGNDIIRKEHIERLLNKAGALDSVLDQAISEELFNLPKGTQKHPKLNGLHLINRSVIETYLRRLLQIDAKLVPFRIIGHEIDCRRTIEIDGKEIILGGRIDRIDEVNIGRDDHHLRIVDYKTGSHSVEGVGAMEEIFVSDNVVAKHTEYVMQAILYGLAIAHDAKPLKELCAEMVRTDGSCSLPISPALLFIQKSNKEDYSPVLTLGKEPITDVLKQCGKEFDQLLSAKISEMLSEQPFTPTGNIKACLTCPYKAMCGR